MVSLLQRSPQFRGHLIHYSTTLGHRMVSLLQRFPQLGSLTTLQYYVHWDTEWCPYYRGFLNSEVTWYSTVLHWDTEWCPYYRCFLNSGHLLLYNTTYIGTQNGVLVTEVSSTQRSLGTLQYYTGTQNGVPITEVSSTRVTYYSTILRTLVHRMVSLLQRFTMESFFCSVHTEVSSVLCNLCM